MKSNSKLNIYAARLFLIYYGILFLYSTINIKTEFASSTSSILIFSLCTSIIGGIISIFLARCLIKEESNKSLLKISIIWTLFCGSFSTIALLIIVIVNTVPQSASERKLRMFINKLWFVPSIINILLGICSMNLCTFNTTSITLFVFGIIFSVGQGMLCKWLISNPYNLEESNTAKPIIKKVLITICIILLINLIFIASLGSEKKENNAFQKNPNSWSDKDKEQVNDFFDWHHDYYD